ncbi:MAG: hypothetical protein HY726_03540 [Candidatus Rokubacteria bacterium]|nr:hypothetical protein [Candidatus Rokubacteria bacterium]
MGECIFCARNAGWFKDRHPECERRHSEAWPAMVQLAAEAAAGSSEVGSLTERLSDIARSSHRPHTDVQRALIAGWRRALDAALEDDLLTEEEEAPLRTYADRFGFTWQGLRQLRENLQTSGTEATQSDVASEAFHALQRFELAMALRDVLEGRAPRNVDLCDATAFNLKGGEQLVWSFDFTDYYELRTKREYIGGYQGVSVRVARGLYYRVGGFRGRPVETEQMEYMDSGSFGITTHHIYFVGSTKALRIPYAKVISLVPHEDGVGVHRETGRLQLFETGKDTGWFVYNVISNLGPLG